MRPIAIAATLALTASGVGAQSDSTLSLEARWSTEQFHSSRRTLELWLSRSLAAPNERLALFVGTLDVSAMLDVRGRLARYRPASLRLPPGESEVVAYHVKGGGARDWTEIGRFPLKVLTRFGLEEGRAVPSLDVSSTAQLGQRVPEGDPPPGRLQRDLTARIGFESLVARSGWQVSTQANAVGVTVQEQRLRWGDLNSDAPAVDLSDYRTTFERGRSRLTIGHSSVGNNRHLLNGFGSRGLSAGVAIGSLATLNGAVMNGTNVVGWSNPLGLERPSHRIASATLGLELLPSRPGALRVNFSGLNGSLQPQSSVNQGAATDAEESNGLGIEVALSDPTQRLNFTGGVTQSRFVNPADRLLSGDTSIVAVRPTTRTARFAELNLQILRGLTIARSLQASLAATVKHERVDPLYRSVGASLQSDLENNAVDITGSFGALSLQATVGRSRDNLANVASILTTRNESQNLSGALPVAQLLRAGSSTWYLPTITVLNQRNHQFGEGVPTGGDFTATHVPDQLSDNWTASSTWSSGSWNLAYRWNQSFQDNRQTGREAADFRGTVNNVSLGFPGFHGLTASLDLSRERQKSLETAQLQRMSRIGSTLQWQFLRATTLSGSVSHGRGVDAGAAYRTRNSELHAELAQGFNLYRRAEGQGQTQGRVFLRYARTRMLQLPFESPSLLVPRIGWSLNAGGSLRLY